MTDEGRRYDAAPWPRPRRLGYAEADPSGDVEGHDAVNKLVILARLAFGVWLDPATIATRRRRARTGRPARASPAVSRGPTAEAARGRRGHQARSPRRPRDDDGGSPPPSCRRRSRSTRALGRTDGVRNRIEIDAEPVGTRRLRRSRARAARRRRRRSSATSWRSPASAGSTWGPRPPAPAPTGDPRAAGGDVLERATASGTRSMTEPAGRDARPRVRAWSSATGASCRSPTRPRR